MGNKNVVFILSDDHGQWAVGAYGNKEVRTPNLDKLAKSGILFNNFYCTSPVCSPARASILTGKMPSQHGVHDWIGNGCVQKKDYENILVSKKRFIASLGDKAKEDYRDIDDNEKVAFTELSQYKFVSHETDKPIQYLEDNITYPKILSENGYRCGIIGKWHLGDSATPQQGFDYWSVIGKGGCIYHLPDFYRNGELEIDDKYISKTIKDESVSFIRDCEKKDIPFCLNVNFTAPHSPWIKEDQEEEVWESYEKCEFNSVKDEGIHPNQVDRRHPGYQSLDKRRYMLQAYYSAVTSMDKYIGDIIDELERLNLIDDTLIIFTSDNGMNLGQHGVWGKGNGTFPMNFYDSSIKVPTIISTGLLKEKNITNESMFSHYDFFPSILDWCEIDYDLDESYPGTSFFPLFDDGLLLYEKRVHVVYDEYGPNRMIRDNQFKYIHRYPYGPNELFDLDDDPNEEENLIFNPKYEKIIQNMEYQLSSWFKKYSDIDVDGIGLGVNGNGQFAQVGQKGKGKKAFKGSFELNYNTM